jgi:putative ABC transport system permease protein
MTAVIRDLKAVWRRAGRAPAYPIVAVLTLGLALAALAAIVAVVEAVILRPLPYRDPARLVAVWEAIPADGREKFRVAAGNFADLREQRHVFESTALFGSAGFRLLTGGEPEQVLGGRVQPEYFNVLGVQPYLGRGFTADDVRPGAERVVILGHGLFQRRFGGRPDLIGRQVLLDSEPHTVVGVMPPRLYPTWPLPSGGISFLPEYQQVLVPLALSASRQVNRNTHVFGVLARLRPGVTIDAARAEVAGLAGRLAREYPASNDGLEFRVDPLADEFSGSSRPLLLTLMAAAALIVALATANLTGLAISRVVERRYEAAVRLALGAPRFALAREALVEAAALSLAGAVLGLALARAGGPLLAAIVPTEMPRIAEAGIGWLAAVVAVGAAVMCAAAVAAGLTLSTTGVTVSGVLAAGGAGARGGVSRHRILHRGLIVAQVGLSVILLSLAGLFGRSLTALDRVETGFVPDGVLTASLVLPPSEYGEWDRVVEFHRALTGRLAGKPDVTAAGVAYDLPLESSWVQSVTLVDGGRAEDASGSVSSQLNIVSPGFFRAAGVRLQRGRLFDDRDDRRRPGAAIVSASFARLHYPDTEAVGRRLRTETPSKMWNSNDAPREFSIVGVVDDVRNMGLDRDVAPTVYLPDAQFPQWEMTVLIRTEGDPLAAVPELRRAVAALDPSLPLARIDTMRAALDRQAARPRFALLVIGAFGGAALLLAALGIYGLLALVVGDRAREIAVRLAVGARPADVAREVVGQACRLTAAGAAIGLLGALAGGRAVQSLLFGVSAADPVALVMAPVALFVTALAAAWRPTRRAAAVDPATTLRA